MDPHQATFSSHGRLLVEEPPRILVAEDDDEMRSLLALVFTEDGYEVVEARDGYEFLEALAEASEQGPTEEQPPEQRNRQERSQRPMFSLVIADLRMPGYDGLDVLVASRRVLDHTPVIVLSAHVDDATRRLALFLRARVVLQKPVDLDDLRMTVMNLLTHPEQAASTPSAAE